MRTGQRTLTPEFIRAAVLDAGNRSMRSAGRLTWNEDDRDAASRESNRLWDAYVDQHPGDNIAKAPKPENRTAKWLREDRGSYWS